MMRPLMPAMVVLCLVGSVSGFAQPSASPVDLTNAVVVQTGTSKVLTSAVDMLQDEIQKRSGVRPGVTQSRPTSGPAIVIRVDAPGSGTPPQGIAVPNQSDGFAVWVDAGGAAPTVNLVGHDERGALFAAGRLIRLLSFGPGRVSIAPDAKVATAPKYPIRGHQIGYRETANTYDLWDVDMYEQYLRDLIIFGTNAVELITALDPTYKDGTATFETQWSMNVKLTELLDRYGIDCWFWMPLEGDVRDPKVAQQELDDRVKFFAECADIDGIMIPGGDPGRTHPADLFPWAGRMAEVLHARFPNAGLWISNQKFKGEELDAFWKAVAQDQPKWLRGIAYGPSSYGTLEDTRKKLPKQYQIRRYPDITHSLRCQYPVPNYHGLFAQTEDREPCNPRPEQMRIVHNRWAPFADGFISYSDGAHDDFNKMLFSSLAWDPDAGLDSILTDYGRVFFGESVASDVAKGLGGLEANWNGSPLENTGIEQTLKVWREVGAKGGPALEGNWRYQLHLFRALFDAYVRERGLAEAAYEKQAREALARARETGVSKALDAAQAALAQADSDTAGEGLEQELLALGPKLHKSIGLQLSIDPPYLAKNPERGALLDKLDRPLNDRPWLEAQFARILAIPETEPQLAVIDTILSWEDPGPGGFYDDLGNPGHEAHLLDTVPYEQDPGGVMSVGQGHYRAMDNLTRAVEPLKYSWVDQAEPPEGDPVRLGYEGLDPNAQYRVRVTYFGRYGAMTRLVADGQYEVHSGMGPANPVWPVEFAVPREATQDGKLVLEFQLAEGRGVQIPEVWLLKR